MRDALASFMADISGLAKLEVAAPNGIPLFGALGGEYIGMDWPVLYKRTKTGAIESWHINVEDPSDIVVSFGHCDGAIQETRDHISEGKNPGKKNETTALEQALKEAQAKWEKQIKKGYVVSMSEAKDGVNALGGLSPMLAHVFDKHGAKIKYPCYIQPKLDGARCVAIIQDGEVTLWTRTRKPITSCPHIVKAIKDKYGRGLGDFALDGELYSHELKSNFEDLMSLVRPDKPVEGHEKIEFHVFDCIDLTPDPDGGPVFKNRLKFLQALDLPKELKLVETLQVNDNIHLMQAFNDYLEQGYEGAIARNADGLYIGSRSYDLQKIKIFQDAEFIIIGVEEGRGKLKGHGIFVCMAPGGKFNVKMDGDTANLKKVWDNRMSYIGEQLTVKYQGMSNYGIPRFPVGKALR